MHLSFKSYFLYSVSLQSPIMIKLQEEPLASFVLEKNLFFFFAPRHVESQFPHQGLNLCPLHWKCRVLTTVPSGKSSESFFFPLAALGLRCCVWTLSNCRLTLVGLLFVAGLRLCCRAWLCSTQAVVVHTVAVHQYSLEHTVVVAYRLRCSLGYGIFPEQGLNSCLLHWQAVS